MKFLVKGLYLFSSLLFFLLATTKLSTAQSIQTDGTTPTQPGSCSGDCLIEGGLQQDNNLFHSFERFNVDAGATVLFQDPGVSNILSRVTGNELSEILGTLGVSGGNANLFLLNPNGIIFGQDSSLDLNGSFLATTADGIRFGEQGFLDTTPNEIPLLTINPSALSFAQGNQGVIRNESIAPAGVDLSGLTETALGLRVPNGKSFLLVAGDVIFDSGQVNAFGGWVELGGLASTGEVQLNFSEIDGQNLSLSFPEEVPRGNVSLTNEAIINVAGEDGGDIAINAENISISEGSLIRAGIGVGLGTNQSQAGNITLNASKSLEISDGSRIVNHLLPEANGNGGDVNINSDLLSIRDQSTVQAVTFGVGNAGDVKINVPNGLIEINNASSVATLVESLSTDTFETIAIGNAGTIQIVAQEILLEDGSFIDASTLGQGNAGNIDIFLEESLNIASDSLVVSIVATEAVGNGGNINLETNSISLENASFIDASTLGQGNAGNIDIFLEEGLNIASGSRIVSVIEPGAIGDAGNIRIEANSISLDSGGQVVSNIQEARENKPGGQGKGGNISLNIFDSVNISGFGTDGLSSGIYTTTEAGALGQAGNIIVNTDRFRIADSGLVSSQTFNQSDGGNIFINANTFEAISGGQIATSASDAGNAGSINIQVADNLLLSGSDPNFVNRRAEFGELVINEAPGNSGLFANMRQEALGVGG